MFPTRKWEDQSVRLATQRQLCCRVRKRPCFSWRAEHRGSPPQGAHSSIFPVAADPSCCTGIILVALRHRTRQKTIELRSRPVGFTVTKAARSAKRTPWSRDRQMAIRSQKVIAQTGQSAIAQPIEEASLPSGAPANRASPFTAQEI